MKQQGEYKAPPWLAAFFKSKYALFALGLAGILLIFFSELPSASRTQAQKATGAGTAQSAEYIQEMEEKLTSILQQVQGAGQVHVMVTLEATGQSVYAQDEELSSSTGQDGQRQSSTRTEHVILDSGTGKAPLLEQAYEPEVRGVAVVCEGGDDILVIGRITELVSVVLGIPTYRFCVTKML